MPNTGSLIKNVLDLAKKVAPLLGPQVGGALAAAQALEALIKDVRAGAGPNDRAALDQQLADIQARVNAHADATIGNLRGGGGS